MKYETIFSDYIKSNQITDENIETVLKEIGYVNFFNDITTQCLGTPKKNYKKSSKVTSSLVYLPDEVKEKMIMNIDIIYVSQLYFGIMTNGNIKFNYPNFKEFLESLVELRAHYKLQLNNEQSDDIKLKNILVKIYMNVVYGMLDKDESVISTDMENPREYITETSKKVMLVVASFFLNKSKPIYYIDTDEIFVPHMNDEDIVKLKEFFKKECSDYTNTIISNVFIEEDETELVAFILGKKKMMVSKNEKMRIKGMPLSTNDNKTLLQNKKFFGRNYKDIFPEYAIW